MNDLKNEFEISDERRKAIREILERPFESHEVSSREIGGGKSAPYIKTSACIRRLNEATDGQWSMRVLDEEWLGEVGGEKSNLRVKVELTIPGLGTRTGMGIQDFSVRSVDKLKGAYSDGMKKAASLFGVALDLVESDESGPRGNGNGNPNGNQQAGGRYGNQARYGQAQGPGPGGNSQGGNSGGRPAGGTQGGRPANFRPPAEVGADTDDYEALVGDTPAPAALQCKDCGKALTNAQAQLSARNYGRELCPLCQKKPENRPNREPVGAR